MSRSVDIIPRTGDLFFLVRGVWDRDVCSYLYRQVLKIPEHFDRRGDKYVRGINSPLHRLLNGFVSDNVELTTYGRYLCGRHDVTALD